MTLAEFMNSMFLFLKCELSLGQKDTSFLADISLCDDAIDGLQDDILVRSIEKP